ncbi:MAG: hypothetical protein A2Z99_06995 [Treponema sp. GWB1_62_6]|nr:MAG: hypothetical protein A2Y36_13155 [Treponema sp. GWA1_62_8]OHE71918.1 MAG: hypothetical protein A2Z99_06995 [Treponema sp. GWB1_62_6]
MALSIRNQEVETLARELARESGQNMTDEILFALRELRERRGKGLPRSIRLAAMIEECRRLPDLDDRPADSILGYDEAGGYGR